MRYGGITRARAKSMVGPGWANILDELYNNLPKRTYVTQVKEKYGSLRFYIGPGSNRTFDLIDKAKKKSEITCEECGAPGKIVEVHGWYTCVCPAHEAEAKK